MLLKDDPRTGMFLVKIISRMAFKPRVKKYFTKDLTLSVLTILKHAAQVS